MTLTDETAGLDEVAAAIGRRPSWLRRHWLTLADEHGFPRKLPTGLVWPRRAVAAWLAAGGVVADQVAPANDNGMGDYIAAASAALKQRYGVTT